MASQQRETSMSEKNNVGSGAVGCVIGIVFYIGGPLLVGWLCISVLGWPKWVGVLLALTLGELASHLIFVSVALPIAALFALGDSREQSGGSSAGGPR
jgi:hypothetical protein